ncbi:MAG TPA: mechanosensitive ion channel domain-containing protein [Anaerolineales bacterium]|nr:mechanosensitive ion channel domain-containing protein [Anaerolineales bacterium]
MIRIWIWNVPLPPGLEFLAQPWASALATLLFWLLLAVVLQFVVFVVIKAIARRSESEVEDVIIDVSRRPLVLAIVLLGAVYSVDVLGLESGFALGLRRWLVAALMAVATYWLWRMMREVVLHYAEILARRSETRADDVLVPIVNQFAPVVIFSIGGAVILEYLGVQLDALLVAIGGAAFIMAFALQDILSNVFSGLSLLVDTPFRYGDLISLEDGKVCQVMKIGMRVTQLYDIGAHAVIYAPNSKLANERLVNLMQPTPELISLVPIVVGQDSDPERVRGLLNDVLLGHPDLLGDLDSKLERIGDNLTLTPEKRAHGRERLAAERLVDESVRSALAELREFAEVVAARERRGVSRDERAELLERYRPLVARIGWLDEPGQRMAAFDGGAAEFIEHIHGDLATDSVAQRTWSWVSVWARDPDLLPEEDGQRLKDYWGERILALLRRVDDLGDRIEQGGGLEVRLDEAVLELVSWLRREYKQATPAWKGSGTSFKGMEGGGFLFRMFFYVDDIELEHFERQSRVEGQVRREAYRRLREQGIALPAPRYEVSWRGDHLPGSEPSARAPGAGFGETESRSPARQ